MKREFKLLYGVLIIFVLAIATAGSTYAFWAATANSASNAVQTESTIFSISMQLNPLYHGFSVIPMNDENALKALANKCKDKYDRGACSAYTIYVYDWNEKLDFISGLMDVSVTNMQNLSYMMLRLSDTYEEGKCAKVEVGSIEDTETKEEVGTIENANIITENYCIVKEATPVGEGVGLLLGDAYDVTGMTETKFILLMWLSNLNYSQNDIDLGSFNATITMQAGNGGQIKGSISSAVKIENMIGGME